MPGIPRLLLLLWLCCCGMAASAQGDRESETRIALVIGNSAYAAVPRLDNPERDAASVAQVLREVGFRTVEVRTNLANDVFRKTLQAFAQEAERADWAVVYFAGHGIEVSGVNYLIPTDARLQSDRDIAFEAVSLDTVLASLEGARKLRVVILDACRDNPFLPGMRRTLASRSVGRGLARVEPELGGTLVAYAAKAGQVAVDGLADQTNSPFAAALVKNIRIPDLEVDFLFRQVRADVLAATDGRQDPATYGALPPQRFIFRHAGDDLLSAHPTQATAPPGPSVPETARPAPAPSPAAPPPTSERERLVSACDRLAANPADPDRPSAVAGVASTAIDPITAIPACQAAFAVAPDLRRIAYQLGRSYGVADRFRESSEAFLKASLLGSTFAMTELGINYHEGRGIKRDQQTGRQWFEKAAALGNRQAMHNLGVLYDLGVGVLKDAPTARGWYEKAARLGQPEAIQRLAKYGRRRN